MGYNLKNRGPKSSTAMSGTIDMTFEKIERFLKESESKEVSEEKTKERLDELVQFCNKGFITQAFQHWSYYSQSSDTGRFTRTTLVLTQFIKLLSSHQETIEFAVTIVKEVLTTHSRIIYRGLTSIRASITNPVIRLLNEIVILNHGALLDDFFALFDFSLAVLPKLLQPSKYELLNIGETQNNERKSIRYCFIRFLLNLIKYSSPLLRKDFIENNSKIISVWFKNMPIIDSEGLIKLTLSTWEEKILKEQSFKRSIKLKFFNEWNLTKLTSLYYDIQDEETFEVFSNFISTVTSDSTYGIVFPQHESWFIGEASNSAPLSVNSKHFKVNNKTLYGVVSNMKPWDDDTQLKVTIDILQKTPELVAPFTNYLASRGLHDPKLTSYWIGQTLLLSNIIRSEIPKDIKNYAGSGIPSKYTITELIVPCVVNRSVLTKCLQSDVFLIRQLSIQLIIDCLQKLEVFINLYEEKNWSDAKVALVNHIYSLLPDLSTVTTCLTDSYTKQSEKKILLVTILTALNCYSLFSDSYNISQAITKPFLDVINSKSFSSIDLVLLDNFFKLQEGETSQLKWWNKSEKSTSLFTSLIKLAASNDSVRTKVTSLLSNLIKQTVVLNYDLVKEDPTFALVHSLAAVSRNEDPENDELSKIWKLLDESISRCVRAPFKYLDQSNAKERISPLILTIFEQWKFVDKKTSYKVASKWIVLFSRYLIIIGEPSSVVIELLKSVELDIGYDDYIFTTSYENSIKAFEDDESFNELSKLYFFEFITTASFKQILDSNSILVDDLGIIGALSRVSSIVQAENISLKSTESILSNILSKVGNYWYTHPESLKRFSSVKYWGSLYLEIPGDKSLYVSNVLGEIFSQLDLLNKSDFSDKVISLLSKPLAEEEQAVLSDSLWSLDNESLRRSLENNSDIIKASALKLFLERKMTIHSDTLANLLCSNSLIPILNEFIIQDLVIFNDYAAFFSSIINIDGTLPIFKSISKHSEAIVELLDFSLAKKDPIFITYIASSLNHESIKDIEDSEALSSILIQGKSKARELLSNEDFSDISFNQLSNIFTNQRVEVTDEEKLSLVDYSLTKISNKYTPEISNLIKCFGIIDSAEVKSWVNKSILYLTKIYAEFTEFPSSFLEFVKSFKDLFVSSKVSTLLNKSNSNALLEVIFTKWVKDEKALEFASVLIVTGTKTSIEFNRLLQILINNEEISLLKKGSSKVKFYTSLIISRLFDFDPSKNSNTTVQEKILDFYNGSTRAEDLLLYDVLEKIESKLNSSWVDRVFNWEFLELLNEGEEDLIGETKFIEKKKEGFLITLNKKFIVNGLKNYDVARHTLTSNKWSEIQSFYDSVIVNSPDGYSETKYDPLFLSLLIINNEELIDITADEETSDLVVKSNMKKLIDSQLFSSVVINLASTNEPLLKVTKSILGSLLNSVKYVKTSSTFKDRHIFELLLTKILYTYTQEQYDSEQFTPLIYIFIVNLIPVLSNPGHILFEKAFRWVLKSPSVRSNEIPLFNEITTIKSGGEDSDDYYKQISWLLNSFIVGIRTKTDIELLRNKKIFEWLLNLENSPYVNIRTRYLIIELISVCQNTEEGGDTLISRFGGLSYIESRISTIIEELTGKSDVDQLQKEQEILNLKQIALKFGIIVKSKKRLAEWTSNDISDYVKRVLKN